jgi:hypothetical protein
MFSDGNSDPYQNGLEKRYAVFGNITMAVGWCGVMMLAPSARATKAMIMAIPRMPLLFFTKIFKKFANLWISRSILDRLVLKACHPYFILGSINP